MLDKDQWRELLRSFVAEAQDLIEESEECLLLLDGDPGDIDAVNRLFRAMHTLKGSAGLFALTPLVTFTHQAESLLMAVRDGQRQMSAELVSLLLECLDVLGHMINQVDVDSGECAVDAARSQPLLDALARYNDNAPAVEVAGTPMPEEVLSGDRWHLSLRLDPQLLRNGFDPASFLRYLGRLGQIVHLTTLADNLPTLAEMDPESCYLGLEIDLASTASKSEIEEVFEFIRDFCTLRILPPASRLDDYIQLIHDLPEPDERIGRLLISAGLLTEQELAAGLAVQESAAEPQPLGEVLVQEGMLAPRVLDAALEKQQAVRERRSAQDNSLVKVPAHKLDELINLVGELVISAAGASIQSRATGAALCIESSQVVAQHVEQIREVALSLRMVEIGDTFNRFHRVVRDVSRQLGKQIRLTIHGADTELDKTVIDRIAEPLTHLVRNAMDHGIESEAERLAVGKSAEGHLELNAYHESGMIVIEIIDDGRGLNTERIREKAQQRGLIDAQAVLSEADVHQLIFAAGFSTADAVSDLSGRGVGMDVVRSAIDGLRGTIEIDSRPGLGCTFRIRLPLTLAIIDGFLVALGADYFVVPLDMVTECIELDARQRLDGAYGYMELRGKPVPCIDLAAHFELPARSGGGRRNIVVVSLGRQQAGLIVDSLHGELQTVIKPLGMFFQHLQGISGSTILGSGHVALILDIASLFRRLQRLDAAQGAGQPATQRLDLTTL